MKKSTIYIIIAIAFLLPLSISSYTFWNTGAFDLVNEVIGPTFWIGLIAFIAFFF